MFNCLSKLFLTIAKIVIFSETAKQFSHYLYGKHKKDSFRTCMTGSSTTDDDCSSPLLQEPHNYSCCQYQHSSS